MVKWEKGLERIQRFFLHDGVFIASLSKCHEGSINVELAKPLAVRKAVYQAKMLRISNIILDGSASSIIKFINDEVDLLSTLGPIIENIHLTLLDYHVVNVL